MPTITCTCASLDETLALAARVAVRLRGGMVVALYGELGAGKTAFARGLARALGVTDHVTSPTFALVQQYQGRTYRLYHVDLYRLDGPAAVAALGLEDWLDDRQAITVVEWAERLEPWLDAGTVRVVLRPLSEAAREITLSGPAAVVAAGEAG